MLEKVLHSFPGLPDAAVECAGTVAGRFARGMCPSARHAASGRSRVRYWPWPAQCLHVSFVPHSLVISFLCPLTNT